MLNTTPILSQPTRAGLPSAGDPSASEATTPPFAQALDEASAQQRGARDEADADAGTPSAPQAPAEVPANATVPSSAAARAAAARKATAQAAVAGGGLPTETATQRLLDEIPRAPTGPADETTPLADEPLPFDLAAWVPGLPLSPTALRQAPAGEEKPALRDALAGTAPAAGRADPRDAGRVSQASNDALRDQSVEVQSPQAVLPKGEGKRVLPSAFDDQRLAGASPQGADKDSSVAAKALAQGMVTTRQSLPIDVARDSHSGTNSPVASIAAAMLQATPAATPSSAPFPAELAVPLGAPEFAPALGSQLSVLVRDGIEHARLKLNPAEMGPIDVRISVDGQQAQVDFSAAHAGTRQILQDAVPALASALRESGLTLTGGGVFDQPREQRGDMQRGPSPQRASAFEDTHEGLPASVQVSKPNAARGVVDLYA